jgi:dihydrofolate synthase/folylpolyglutamate synthase
VTAVDSLEDAVEMSLLLAGKEDVIIAFGSLSYLGRLMEIVAEKKVR